MTQRTLSRRLLVGGTSAALLAGVVGFVPLLGSASAACTPTYTDPAGDAVLGPDPTGMSADGDLDLTAISYSVDDGVFSTVVTLKALADQGPANSSGDIFTTAFTVVGKAVKTSVVRDYSGLPFATSEVSARLTVAGTPVASATAVVDLKASTATVKVPVADLAKALGADPTGKPFSAMTAETRADYGFTNSPSPEDPAPQYDTATAPATAAYAFGASCSGGGTPAATGSSTPAPTGSGSPSPTATPTSTATPAPGGLFDLPRKGCATYTDPVGDADPTSTGRDNEASLDVTQVNLKSPADGSLQVFVKLNNLAGGLNWAPFEGGSYVTSLTIGGKAIAVTVDDAGTVSATVGGKASADLAPIATLDPKNSNLVLTLPAAGLAKVLGAPLAPGTAVTGTAIATAVTSPAQDFPADDAAGTKDSEKTYAYGDNTCFLPPPAVLTLDADPKGQYTDQAEVLAHLEDADGATLTGATLTAVLAGAKPVTGTTDSDGYVDFLLPITVPAGSRTVTVSFAGTPDAGPAKALSSLTVLAEKTVLRAVAVRGGVSATLRDDDKHVVAGQPVVFTVGSKKYVVKTSAKGVATVTKLPKGTAVKVSYAGSKGYYLAAPAVSVKAG